LPSPVGHSLAGVCGYFLVRKWPSLYRREYLLVGAILIANLPDLDILPLLLFEIRSVHRQWTHSLVAAAGFAILFGGLSSRWNGRGIFYGTWGGAVYLSHILLDMLLDDPSPPHGVKLLWPFTNSYFIFSFTPFASFSYGNPDVNIIEMFFLPHNLATMARELFLLTPWVALACFIGNRLWKER
jgi:inner membrane protein